MVTPLDNPLWQFSNTIYRDSQVKSICLTLQNQWHYNVNLVLFCGWLSHTKRLVSAKDMQYALHLVAEWQARMTEPLRGVRQYLATLPPSARIAGGYDPIIHLELVSESLQQDALYKAFKDKPQTVLAPVKHQNLLYLSWLADAMHQAPDETIHRLFLDLIHFSTLKLKI
ncbi:TIGR02444 family protein [Legionella erythra]|uniref:TIGR02444 family protein n=1 Tax=Legionella erythra TaxID=448 RepID=A0A0W0TUU8_LEGER|nr:TIGR02444 family protein [Legionella erythra]KTC99447.1 hypothetical protein Lery_0348 [Legionella erythra]